MTGRAFDAEQARSALRAAVPDLDMRERRKQIEITTAEAWYAAGQKLQPNELASGLLQREQSALASGYAGLRTSGNCAWVSEDQWADFLEYEAQVQEIVRGRRMICMCSYCLDTLNDGSPVQIMERHDLTLPRASRSPASGLPIARDQSFARRKRTFDLAMMASNMGTWRYTLADNICIYDENAQRLYGLTEARFVHDDEGTKSKFHADDLDLMWSRVGRALDPAGDGRYDVEYRVRQIDGSWRWLSAWGLVEFEGEGRSAKP